MPPYTNPQRDQQIAELDEMLMGLKTQQGELANSFTDRQPLNPSQLFTTAVASLVPILVGYAANGAKGGAIGAQAGGALGANVIGGMMEDQKLNSQKNKALYELSREEARDLRTERRQLETQAAQAIDANLRQEDQQAFLSGENAKREAGMEARAAGRADKSDDRLLGSEGERVRKAYMGMPLVKSAQKSIEAATWMKGLLQGGTAIDAGQLSTQLPILAGEVGVKTDKDVARNLPDNLQSESTKVWNYINGDVSDPLTPQTRQAILALTERAYASAVTRLGAAKDSLRGQSGAIAPYANRKGKDALDNLFNSLGSEYTALNQQKPSVQFGGKTYSPDQVGYLIQNNLLSPEQLDALRKAGYK